MLIKNITIFLLLGFFTIVVKAQEKSPLYKDANQKIWVDSVYNSLSLDQKIGQLFMVAAYSNQDQAHENKITSLIQREHIGGLIFMQDNPQKQFILSERYQNQSKVPLLIGMDAEWDVSMRLKETNKFPWAMTMGAVGDEAYITQASSKIGQHLKELNAHFNFAPVVDVNVNPANPIIGNRSFGSNPNNVSSKAIAYIDGLHQEGILSSIKHFPGHGDTNSDSHKTLPQVNHDLARLNKIELAPFKKLIDEGATSVMVAHLAVPALEPNTKIPATLSKKIVTGLLKNKLGFKGLIITDALNMKGVTKYYEDGETDRLAFEAGNDILLFSQNVAKAKAQIKVKIKNNKALMLRLEESVKKILMAKYYVGLNKPSVFKSKDFHSLLNDYESKAITFDIFKSATTLLQNENQNLPIRDLTQKIGVISLGEGSKDIFHEYLNRYTKVDLLKPNDYNNLNKLKSYDKIIVSVHKSNASPYKSYKLKAATLATLNKVKKHVPTTLVLFSSPYALKTVQSDGIASIIVAYQNHEYVMQIVPQIIFGAIKPEGKLPVDVNATFQYGDCVDMKTLDRLEYVLPENLGINSHKLKEVDNWANSAIQSRATPGMQILAAKDGKVFFNKSYGYHTYDKKQKVEWDDLYDVASITKISTTLPIVMQMVDSSQLNLSERLKDIVPYMINSNKENVTLKEVLTHQGGLYAWIPFYKSTIDSVTYNYLPGLYARQKKKNYSIQVADNLFLTDAIKDSILSQIKEKENIPKRYKYSDLGFYLMKDYIERTSNTSLDKLATKNFFEPLGMNFTTYNPLSKFNKKDIVPTENDAIFRKQLVHGYVHDQGAAMQSGIGGHAGIFSNANDLAKLMQMYLNNGSYADKDYIQPETISKFTSYANLPHNRRGLGFDKQLNNKGYAYRYVSPQSFGHTGFTGTMAWADPTNGLIYIFLSNRIYPDASNRKLIKQKIRQKIQKSFYEAIPK